MKVLSLERCAGTVRDRSLGSSRVGPIKLDKYFAAQVHLPCISVPNPASVPCICVHSHYRLIAATRGPSARQYTVACPLNQAESDMFHFMNYFKLHEENVMLTMTDDVGAAAILLDLSFSVCKTTAEKIKRFRSLLFSRGSVRLFAFLFKSLTNRLPQKKDMAEIQQERKLVNNAPADYSQDNLLSLDATLPAVNTLVTVGTIFIHVAQVWKFRSARSQNPGVQICPI